MKKKRKLCVARWERRTEVRRLQVFIEIKCKVTTTSHGQILGGAKCEIVISTCSSKFNSHTKVASKLGAQQLIFTSRCRSGPNNREIKSRIIDYNTMATYIKIVIRWLVVQEVTC
jgi:hypothetical protein